MMNNPQIGIIIPSYNDQQFLEKLFESLYSTNAGASFLPVIVDDQSNDGTEHWVKGALKGYAVVIRPKEKAFFTQAVNAGIHWHGENSHPASYFLLNSDVVVTDGWGAALLATSQKLNAGIVGATLLYPDGRVQHAGGYGVGYHFDINKPRMRYYEDRYVPWSSGSALMIRREVVDRIGLLSGDGRRGQYDASDRLYCTTARMVGFEIAVSAGCILYHYTLEAEAIRRPRGDY